MESQTTSRTEAAASRRASLEQDHIAALNAELRLENAKAEHASELKKEDIEDKRSRAQASLDDVAAARARAQLSEAIRDSTVSLEYHDHELKSSFADARRSSVVEHVQEKQAVLQHGHSYETVNGEHVEQ
ncbi:hypothetical protein HDU98_007266 [Podochytrium sp. JEL0797]|nr:hypothetical protein HDU98_007266 [Podochytrium sp. JEL0797]